MKFLPVLIATMFLVPAVKAGGEHITYEVNGASYTGYYTSPSDDAPLVLLVHDWNGLTDYEMQRADMLAGEGYAVFAADLFGTGIRPTRDSDKRQHTGELYKDRARMRALLQGALTTAHGLGADRNNAIAMGYCFGGAAVLELARSGADLKGFVTFHGGLTTPEGQDYSKTRSKVVVFHGSADTAITMQDFATLAVELESAQVAHEMITYGGAPHAFTEFTSDRYREYADRASWQRFLSFLQETL